MLFLQFWESSLTFVLLIFYAQKYDYHSVMHYSAFAGIKEGAGPSMTPLKDGVTVDELGSRVGMSPIDIEELNAVYG